jgi:hypothetical protein
LHEFGIKGTRSGYKCIIDGWPLVAVVGCNSIITIKFSSECWVDGAKNAGPAPLLWQVQKIDNYKSI